MLNTLRNARGGLKHALQGVLLESLHVWIAGRTKDGSQLWLDDLFEVDREEEEVLLIEALNVQRSISQVSGETTTISGDNRTN